MGIWDHLTCLLRNLYAGQEVTVRTGYGTTERKKVKLLSCVWLCDPVDCNLPGSFVLGILQVRILELLAISFSRGIIPTQGSNPGLPHCRQMLYPLSHQGSPGTIGWFQIGKGVCQGCILSPSLFNLYAEYIMRNAGLQEAQAGIKITRRNSNNLR